MTKLEEFFKRNSKAYAEWLNLPFTKAICNFAKDMQRPVGLGPTTSQLGERALYNLGLLVGYNEHHTLVFELANLMQTADVNDGVASAPDNDYGAAEVLKQQW